MALFALDETPDPQIRQSPRELGDSPHDHRWRAVFGDNEIHLQAYKVVKQTPTGVWISEGGYGWYAGDWHPYDQQAGELRHCRWVGNDSGQAWAKKTRDEAIKSLAIRLTRWASRLSARASEAVANANMLAALRPDLEQYADAARNYLED